MFSCITICFNVRRTDQLIYVYPIRKDLTRVSHNSCIFLVFLLHFMESCRDLAQLQESCKISQNAIKGPFLARLYNFCKMFLQDHFNWDSLWHTRNAVVIPTYTSIHIDKNIYWKECLTMYRVC